ncbi:NADH-quinone oxidoreductase subunit C [Streptomyces sp. NPDC046977]|uniref:NADH-quinone oxidoreductase subunit C n=1 Tax=Streptomyces sp. NPDC046977 TaxID=3154703 RepID=UPI0033CEC7BA
MTSPFDRLPDPAAVAEVFGPEATAEETYGLLTVDVPAGAWTGALRAARDVLGCTFFDWLSAVDEPGTGFQVCAHVVAPSPGSVRRLLIRTTVPHEAPVLPTATEVWAGAAWHERETHEMFGVGFTGHPHLAPLLLPDGFEGHPLRKDFVLAARVAKAWPGAKEPGEPSAGAAHGGPKRRQMLPPGVPDPNDWGPLKGQLPPAPARPARTPRAAGAGAAAAPGERPARRARSVGEGSVSQGAAAPAAPPRRTRSAGDGSVSRTGAAGTAEVPAEPSATPRRPTPDAPWDVPRDTPATGPAPEAVQQEPAPAEPPAGSPAAEGEAAPSVPGGDAAGTPATPHKRTPDVPRDTPATGPAPGAAPQEPAPAEPPAESPAAEGQPDANRQPDTAGSPGHDDAEGGGTP